MGRRDAKSVEVSLLFGDALIRSDETFVDLSRSTVDVVVDANNEDPLPMTGELLVLTTLDKNDVVEASISISRTNNNTRYAIDFIVFSHPIVGMEIQFLRFQALAFHSYSIFSHNFHNDALHFGV